MNNNLKLIIIALVCLGVGAVAGNYIPLGSLSGGMNEAKVKTIVADYIAENPEKIIESLQGMQAKSAQDMHSKASEAVKSHLDALGDDENSPVIGSDESGITIVEFFDYHCGYCKRMSDTIQRAVKAHPDVKFIFKEFPILSDESTQAARASLAVYYLNPKRYFDFYMMLMKHQGSFTQEALDDYAGQAQVDLDAFHKEMQSERVTNELKATQELAAEIGVQGTPALVVGEDFIPGAIPFADLDAHIKALKEKK